jgi:hypothetical protein
MQSNFIKESRSWEWELYDPLAGASMLELGNKRKSSPSGDFTYKQVFESLGFRHVSVDINGQDGALPKDLTKPLNLGTFDMVSNIGTTEHVSEGDYSGQVACWRNILEAMHVGSVLVSITPQKGSWLKHGVWYPQQDFFKELAELNGLTLDRCYTSDERKPNCPPHLRLIFARLTKTEEVRFQMPKAGMYRNKK